jgi:hypothetical protein
MRKFNDNLRNDFKSIYNKMIENVKKIEQIQRKLNIFLEF